MSNPEKKSSALAIVSIVLGILALCISFIPFLNLGVIPLAAITMICGVISIILICFKRASGLVLTILGLLFAIGGWTISGSMYTAMDEALTSYEDENQITLTLEDLESIEEGMTYDEVVAILGEPDIDVETEDAGSYNWTTFGFVGDKAAYYSVSVSFKDDVATTVTMTTDLESAANDVSEAV